MLHKKFDRVQKKEKLQLQSFPELFVVLRYTEHDDVLFRMLANGCFWLSKCVPNLTKRKRLGDYSAPYAEATDIQGLAGEVKYVHTVFLFYCSVTSYYKKSDSKQYKLVILQFPWIKSTDTADLSSGLRVLPGHIQGVSWAVVSSEAQAVGRIQFLVVAGLRFHSHAGCQLVATQRS